MLGIDNYWEILALHKAIMAAKFGNSGTKEMVTSPHLAEVARKVLCALEKAERERSGDEKADRWEAWKKADEGRSEWGKLLAVMDGNQRMKELNVDDAAREIRDILSPLEVSDDQVSELIKAKLRK